MQCTATHFLCICSAFGGCTELQCAFKSSAEIAFGQILSLYCEKDVGSRPRDVQARFTRLQEDSVTDTHRLHLRFESFTEGAVEVSRIHLAESDHHPQALVGLGVMYERCIAEEKSGAVAMSSKTYAQADDFGTLFIILIHSCNVRLPEAITNLADLQVHWGMRPGFMCKQPLSEQ